MLFRVRSKDKRPVPRPWFRQFGKELSAHQVDGEDVDVWEVACGPGTVEVGAEGFDPSEVTAHDEWFRNWMPRLYKHTHVRLTPHR